MQVTREHLTGTYGTMYYVRDMKKAVAYYRDAVGLELGMESDYWAEFKAENGKNLCLHLAEPSMKDLPGGVIILNVTKMNDLVKKLRAQGVEVTGEPKHVHADDYTVDFVDPDGNCVSYYGTL